MLIHEKGGDMVNVPLKKKKRGNSTILKYYFEQKVLISFHSEEDNKYNLVYDLDALAK